jgi:SAM-dependent methyltransferase
LERCAGVAAYTLLDFSEPMLALSRMRLAAFPAALFVRASFKAAEWTELAGGPFDAAISMQAVHELRHKRHAGRLYEEVHRVLARPGLFMVCDHAPFDDSPRSQALYMTPDEQQSALRHAGFAHVRVVLENSGLFLYSGEKATDTRQGTDDMRPTSDLR